MEPPVRPYHPNSPKGRNPRGERAAKRQPATSSRKMGDGTGTAKQRGRRAAGELPRSGASSQRSDATPGVVERASVAEAALPDGADAAQTDYSAALDINEEALESADATTDAGESAGSVVGMDDFEDIFTRFQTPITNFVYRLVGNREQAYDLAQDVFVKAYRALAGGATIQAGALSSWLYRIASNTATDALRRRRLISWLPLSLFNDDRGVGAGMPGSDNSGFGMPVPMDERLASAMGSFTASYDGGRFEQRVADREIVERVLKRLPEKYAACLLLYEHEGFSCAEIADVLNVTPSAVKMRLMRARERFISLYQQELEGRR